MSRTHYDVLGLPMNANAEEIRAAYRSLAKKFHPDVSSDPDAPDRFVELQNSYEILGDPQKKVAYDTQLLKQMVEVKPAPPRTKPKSAAKPAPKPAPPKNAQQRAAEVQMQVAPDILRMTGFITQGRIAEAEKLAQKVSARDPQHPVPYAVLGDVARLRGDLNKAAKFYALAAQMDPKNSTYLRKHEEVISAIKQLEFRQAKVVNPTKSRTGPISVAMLVLLAGGTYVMFGDQKPMFAGIGVINTWTLGLFVMLIVCGITFGSVLALSGMLTPFQANHGTATGTVAPPILLGMVAVVNFWFATMLYGLVAISQDSFNSSTSRVIGISAMITLFFTVICAATQHINGWQVLIWGGNMVYISALCGWMVTDGLTEV